MCMLLAESFIGGISCRARCILDGEWNATSGVLKYVPLSRLEGIKARRLKAIFEPACTASHNDETKTSPLGWHKEMSICLGG